MLSNDQIKSRFAKARKAQAAGRLTEAAAGYRALIKQAPNLAEAYFNLAEIFSTKAMFGEAGPNYEAALKLRPQEPAIWLSYLNMAERHPNTDNLARLLTRAQPVVGHLPAFGFLSGMVCVRRGATEDALPLFKSAIAKGFNAPRAYVEYGVALAALGRNDDALVQYQHALAKQPNNSFALARKSELLRDMGQFEEALATARGAIAYTPESAPLYYTYCSIAKVQAGDPMIANMETLAKKPALDDPSKTFLGHALAKAAEDTGDKANVFGYLKMGNDANLRAHPFDIEQDRRSVAEFQAAYLKMEGGASDDASDVAPIFVTGLPRSGTTLVEQILSTDAGIEGGGELGILGDMFAASWDGAISPQALSKIGHDYAAQLVKRFPDARQVTDKSISTYAQIGFVKRALPNAKIVVVRRDPADNALSIYKNMFAPGTHRYASSLTGIAQFMRLFESQLDFWRQHCPDDFVEISYETLTTEPEPQIRALVDAVGLEWDDGFLASHENTRKITTLSAAQVRQPIYASSVKASAKYETELEPFLTEYAKLDPLK